MTKNDSPVDPKKHEWLKDENARLQEEVDAYKRSAKRTRKASWSIGKFLTKLFFGGSVTRNFNAASDAWLKWSRTKAKNDFARAYFPSRNFAGAVVSRFTRAGILGLLIGVVPTFLLWRQTVLFTEQNKKFDIQNREFIRQNNLFAEQNNKFDLQNEQFKTQNEAILDQFQQAESFERRRELNQELQAIVLEISRLSQAEKFKRDVPFELPNLIDTRIRNLRKDAIWWDVAKEADRRSNIRGSLLVTLLKLNALPENIDFGLSNLKGVKLPQSSLVEVNLAHSNMQNIDLSMATLVGVDLIGSDLSGAHLDGAVFKTGMLEFADMHRAKLTCASILRSELYRADLKYAVLRDADLSWSDLSKANLSMAHLDGVNLEGANLSNAILYEIRGWEEIKSIEGANIYGVKNPPGGFLSWALKNGAVETLPDQSTEYFKRLYRDIRLKGDSLLP